VDIQVTSLLLLCAFLTLVNLSYHEHIVIRYACRTGDRGFIGRRQAVGVRRSRLGIDGHGVISRKVYPDCTLS